MRRFETPEWLIYAAFAGITWPVTDMFGWKALILCLSIMVFWYSVWETLVAILNQIRDDIGRLDNNQLAIWRERPPWISQVIKEANNSTNIEKIENLIFETNIEVSAIRSKLDQIEVITSGWGAYEIAQKLGDIQYTLDTLSGFLERDMHGSVAKIEKRMHSALVALEEGLVDIRKGTTNIKK